MTHHSLIKLKLRFFVSNKHAFDNTIGSIAAVNALGISYANNGFKISTTQ